MKKLFVAILAILYISTTTGATLHIHYCMGELADWGLGQNKSKTCGECGMEKTDEKYNGCCKDEFKFIKNTADQKTTQSAFQLVQLIVAALPVSFIEIPFTDFPFLAEENPINHAPPRSSSVAVYIRNCVFLI